MSDTTNEIKEVADAFGNVATIAFWGSEDAARQSLLTLTDCSDCIDCIDCSYCSYCSDCRGCSGCSDCIDCIDCSYCSDCRGCSGCSYCSYCRDCSYCRGCRGCIDCIDCSYCRGCRGCSYCSDCIDCSYCSGCRGCSYCSYCSDCRGEKSTAGDVAKIPTIPNIDAAVYRAVTSTPDALKMADVHTCETTHCRAGWAVHLAGEVGYALERRFGWCLAAQLIYRESGSPCSPVRFFDNNVDALADMKERAEAANPN